MSIVSFDYDKKHDILYISLDESRPSFTEEIVSGIILRYDINTEQLTGITILDFFKKLSAKDVNLKNLPIEIDFSNINLEDLCH